MPRGPRPSVSTALDNLEPGATWSMIAVPFGGDGDSSRRNAAILHSKWFVLL